MLILLTVYNIIYTLFFCTLFFWKYFSINFIQKLYRKIELVIAIITIIYILFFTHFLGQEFEVKIGISGALFYIVSALLWYFYKLSNPNVDKITTDPVFWVSTALLLWGCFFIFRVIPMYSLQKTDPEFLHLLKNMLFIVNILMYVMFYIALMKYEKISKTRKCITYPQNLGSPTSSQFFVIMLFVGFIVLVVFLYNKKQLFYLKEKQLKETEYKNEILQKELERQKSILQERERISHDMHDDLGAGISALKLQTEFLRQKVGDNSDLQNDIDDLLKTSSEMNISMREMLWSLNSSNDTLYNFVQYVSIYAENFFLKTNIHFLAENYCKDLDRKLNTEVRRNLFLCIKESLNNAYKHSHAENIKLIFNEIEKKLIVEIIDDGIGLNKDLKNGNGLQNMKLRMKNINGCFEIKFSEKGLHLIFFVNF